MLQLLFRSIAAFLTNHTVFKTHARHINRDVAKSEGLFVENLESDPKLQDLVLSLFHATTHTFSGIRVVKIIDNQIGSLFAKEITTEYRILFFFTTFIYLVLKCINYL